MSLIITEEAAQFILARIPRDQMPLRLTKKTKGGCGDIAHQFIQGGKQGPDDTLVEAFGLSLVCDFFENPEFADASIVIRRGGVGIPMSEKIVVLPNGSDLCGCGESVVTPKS